MLTLICGIPNAGKTTYSKRYGSVLHLDNMPHPLFSEKYRQCAERASEIQGDVCVEGLYTERKWRMMLLEACKHQSPKVCIWLNTPAEECIRREKAFRKRDWHMVRYHYDQFKAPDLDEGWDEIIKI